MKHLSLTLLVFAMIQATAQPKDDSCDAALSQGTSFSGLDFSDYLRDLHQVLEPITSGTYFSSPEARPVLLTGRERTGKSFQLNKLDQHLTAQNVPHLIVERAMLGEPADHNLANARGVRAATEDYVRFIMPNLGHLQVSQAHTHPRVERQAYLDGLMLKKIESLGGTPGLFVLVDLTVRGPGNSPYRTAETLENLIALRERFKFKMLVTQSTAELDSVRAELSDRAVERVLSDYHVIDLDRVGYGQSTVLFFDEMFHQSPELLDLFRRELNSSPHTP